ncbi:ABC transporter substrate-binding protein [Paenibacillus darwinianus]|uniref:ABC transporter substrate-binding protein n=1 Tax=Paenibacillus darwinianus TaxID=1380763 RepID=A0A9W5RZK8_9BACL|nr:sugar ABC transporter substrate-binding protein [Paenibacillus darwinianus]EXX85210.1 ABC transporter substrate-binding protein [Paenibacillus darwinianus]EXX85266.1 ABC transporter substrate-binding protein [Paenibacillus darwinianus]EXX85459.1 ABC transporter substrate-binding protein [Paenibacillus darwinianus]
MKKLRWSALVMVLVFGLVLTACGGGNGGGNVANTGGTADNTGNTGGNDKAADGDKPAASVEKVKIKWATWGNPGELTRFQEYTKDFNVRNPDIQVELIPIPGEYEQKIITQLSGGTAPDAFYAGDSMVVKLIENGTIEELTPFISGEGSVIKEEDFFPGLWGAAKADGKIWGVPVDNNPMVLWFNKKVLKDAGITEMPTDLQAQGEWNWQAFQEMTEKIKASKKYGYVLDNWWGHTFSWVTSNGGNIYDENGKYIAYDDPKAMEAFKFLYDNVKSKNITFAGTLPKGQGADAMFMSNQVGFVGAGRWYLPLFKRASGLEYDIVTWPTNTGKAIEPAGIPTAYMVLNKASKNKEVAYKFLAEFVSKEGQTFRLSGGGNAVPSVIGADVVVSEGNQPANYKAFLDAREIGYALTTAQAGIPGLDTEINTRFEALWLKNQNLNTAMKEIQDAANKKIDDYKNKK